MICDVSKHQGKIDWDKLGPQLDFCMIKASGKTKDSSYAQNAAECKRLNKPFHAYHFLYCTTEAAAKKEAKRFFDAVGNTSPLFWVLDCEKEWGVANSKARKIAEAFEAELRRLAGNAIRVALYIGHDKYKDYALDYGRYAYIWIPRYRKVDVGQPNGPKPDFACDIWQYTSKGKLDGISGNVDLNMLISNRPLSYYTQKDGGDSMANNHKKYIMNSGTHYISNSGSDENGKYHGGTAGDQNGKEWRLINWYNRPWTVVLRWPDINVATLIAQLSIDAALNDKVGYDQYQRNSYWNELKKVGFLPSMIKTPCEEDCTAGVNANVHAAGYLLDIPAIKAIKETGIRSTSMRKAFTSAGFIALTDAKYLKNGDYLLPGDVLLCENHHAAVNVTKGSKVSYEYRDVLGDLEKYKGKPAEPIEPEKPVKLGDRTLKLNDVGNDVKELQQDLLMLGYKLPDYGADGEFGEETEKAVKKFQKAQKLTVDGVMEKDDYAALTAALKNSYSKVEITGHVNIRSAPGYDSKIYGTAKKGASFTYRGETKQAEGKDWYAIDFNGKNAWVSSKYSRLVK